MKKKRLSKIFESLNHLEECQELYDTGETEDLTQEQFDYFFEVESENDTRDIMEYVSGLGGYLTDGMYISDVGFNSSYINDLFWEEE